MILAVRHEGDVAMPPKKKLAADRDRCACRVDQDGGSVAGVRSRAPSARARVRQPDRDGTNRARSFWAFQPRRVDSAAGGGRLAMGRSRRSTASSSAKLEEKGIRPAPPADEADPACAEPRSISPGCRRRPRNRSAFLATTSPLAFERVVDRLLASPRYGERWGRHWLDLVRYADSNGMDDNLAYSDAWRYRDYVIASFNADKAYDRFVEEQLAGDLLAELEPARRDELIVATGFPGDRAQDARRGRPGQAADGHRRRAARHDLPGVHGAYDGLCPLPRSQVRPARR